MSTFNSAKRFKATSSFIPYASKKVMSAFAADGFDCMTKPGAPGKTIIEVTKGNLVRQAVGLKQGLEISFRHDGDYIDVEAKGTVVKNQLVASAITLFVTWPVLIPQIIGLIKQSHLDEKAIALVEAAWTDFNIEQPVFCTHCGEKIIGGRTVCSHCGKTL